MVRIWYSVMGDGLGHAMESGVVISHLKKKHKVFITAAGKAYPYLKAKFKDVHYIQGDSLYYHKNKVLIFATIGQFTLTLPQRLANNIATIKKIRKFNPDLCISDFESFAHYYCIFTGLPCLSIDMVHGTTETRFKPEKNRLSFLISKMAVKFLHPRSDLYVIPTFAKVTCRRPHKTTLVHPILRDDIRKAKTSDEGYAVIYQTSPTDGMIIPLLKKTGIAYRIYGTEGQANQKHLTFKPFNEKTFISDLSGAKFLISNGGFTTLAEAIYLHKPVLSLPLHNQGEQLFNAQNLKARGFGTYTFKLTTEEVEAFRKRLPFYKRNLKKQVKWDNSEAFERIDKAIQYLCN